MFISDVISYEKTGIILQFFITLKTGFSQGFFNESCINHRVNRVSTRIKKIITLGFLKVFSQKLYEVTLKTGYL